jgi:hypothetical protein
MSVKCINTHQSCLIPEGVAKASQIYLRDAQCFTKLAIRNTLDLVGVKPITVGSQSISGVSAIL